MSVAFKAKIVGVLMFITLLSGVVEAGRFYVVIATFTEEDPAREFATSLEDLFEGASFRFDSKESQYHVYVMETDRQEQAENFRTHLQEENGFLNAWILADLHSSGDRDESDTGLSDNSVMLELYTGGAVLLGSADNSYFSINKNQGQIREAGRGGSADGFTFFAETPGGVSLPGSVMLMDKEGNPVSTFKTGEFVSFEAKQANQVLTLVCQVPGYNPETKIIPLNRPGYNPDVILNSDGVWEARFGITRSKVNEIDLLYQGVFHPDAAVLKPDAKTQLDVLLALMQANADWSIEINSHCNPGDKREIMLPGRQSYFDIAEATGRNGSDKQLTRARAETFRDYLVENGIESNRVTVMGWGSLDMLVKDKEGDVGLNERVEVNITSPLLRLSGY